MSSKLELEDDGGCFACGKHNPIGLKLEFGVEEDDCVTYFTPSKEHQGWMGIVHGGITSTILDEVMARCTLALGQHAVTAEMTVRFKRPSLVGHRLRFAGRIDEENSRMILCSARATDEDGTLIAEATGKMVRVAT